MILESRLLSRLPRQFDALKRKKAHYVSRIAGQTGDLRNSLWIGMTDSSLYSNPREGIQYQFGVSRDVWNVNGIWIEGTYDARPARLNAAGRLMECRQELTKALRRLGAGFDIRISTLNDGWLDPISSQDFRDADLDELIDFLPHRETYVHIGKPLGKKDILALGDRVVDETVTTFKKLLPIYRLTTEGATEVPLRRHGRVASTQVIHESASWGMKVASEFEEENKRDPKDVSESVEGYDIESKDKTGKTRYIEVKSRRGGFRVALTKNEYETAKRKGARYFVYVVRGDGSIRIIQNPVRACRIEKILVPMFEIVDWVEKSRVYNTQRRR